MSFKCPNCQTSLYSRAHRLCVNCGVPLPPDLLLPEGQVRHFEKNLEQEKEARLAEDSNLKLPDAGPDGF